MVTRSDLSVAVLAVRWVLQESEERQHSRLHLFSISWNVLRRPECTRKKKCQEHEVCKWYLLVFPDSGGYVQGEIKG